MSAGAQIGNRNSSKGREWSDAVRRAMFAESNEIDDKGERKKKLYVAATQLVDLACEGDMAALKECGDRLDGKPAQAITGPQGEPITLVQRVIVQVTEQIEESEVIDAEVIQELLD